MSNRAELDAALWHYCKGTWVKGFVLDCELAEEHNVRLMQTDSDYKASLIKLGKSGHNG